MLTNMPVQKTLKSNSPRSSSHYLKIEELVSLIIKKKIENRNRKH